MFRAKLIAFIAVAILFTQLQCVAACTNALCGFDFGKTQSVPPCHRHHDHSHDRVPSTCWHQAINPPAIPPQSIDVHVPILSIAAVTSDLASATAPQALAALLKFSVSSPPEYIGPPLTVLRI